MEALNLNIDLKDTDTSMPVLAAGNYLCSIKEASPVPNKAETGHNLLVIFSTQEENETNTGGVANAGYQFRKYYPLQASENPSYDFKRDLAKLYDAAFNPESDADRPEITLETIASLVECDVIVGVKITDNEQYGPQNEVRSVKAVG